MPNKLFSYRKKAKSNCLVLLVTSWTKSWLLNYLVDMYVSPSSAKNLNFINEFSVHADLCFIYYLSPCLEKVHHWIVLCLLVTLLGQNAYQIHCHVCICHSSGKMFITEMFCNGKKNSAMNCLFFLPVTSHGQKVYAQSYTYLGKNIHRWVGTFNTIKC